MVDYVHSGEVYEPICAVMSGLIESRRVCVSTLSQLHTLNWGSNSASFQFELGDDCAFSPDNMF